MADEMTWLRLKDDPQYAGSHLVWRGHHQDNQIYRGEIASIEIEVIDQREHANVTLAWIAMFNPALNRWFAAAHLLGMKQIGWFLDDTVFDSSPTYGHYVLIMKGIAQRLFLVPPNAVVEYGPIKNDVALFGLEGNAYWI